MMDLNPISFNQKIVIIVADNLVSVRRDLLRYLINARRTAIIDKPETKTIFECVRPDNQRFEAIFCLESGIGALDVLGESGTAQRKQGNQ